MINISIDEMLCMLALRLRAWYTGMYMYICYMYAGMRDAGCGDAGRFDRAGVLVLL